MSVSVHGLYCGLNCELFFFLSEPWMTQNYVYCSSNLSFKNIIISDNAKNFIKFVSSVLYIPGIFGKY